MFNFLEDVNITKEKEKNRKKRYGEELRLQIEQNKKRKLEEKLKSRQESLRNLKLFQSSQLNNNITLNNDNELLENFNNNYHYLKASTENPLNIYKINENFLTLTNKKNSYDNIYNNLKNNIRKRLEESYKRPEINFTEKNNSYFNSYLHNDNKKNNFVENGIYIMKKSPSLILNNNNYHSENFNNYINENTKNNYNNIINNALMAEINLQFLFKEFVEQQIKTINNYENNIENIFFYDYKNKNDNSIKSLLEEERNRAIQSIKNEQNKLKNTLGFFPMENNYNLKIEQLFNKILNKKISTYSSIKDFDNLILNILKNNQNDNVELWRYKSKYEDENIENSIPDFQKLSISSQNTLRGYSKLVKINNNENEIEPNLNNNFLETWREQLENEISEDKNKDINNHDNNILNDINMNHNLNKDEKENGYNLKENLKIFPSDQIFKNVQNIEPKKNINVNNIDLNKNNNYNLNENNFRKKYKSAKNIFDAKFLSNNNQILKKENMTPKSEYNINSSKNLTNIQNGNKSNLIYQKNINKNNIIKKGKHNFNIKKADPSFMKNVKKVIPFTNSNDISQNYQNFLVLKRDDKRKEENNEKNKDEFGNFKTIEKLKSPSVSSESEKT